MESPACPNPRLRPVLLLKNGRNGSTCQLFPSVRKPCCKESAPREIAMATIGLSSSCTDLRVGHVYLDVRQRRLHCLNEEARQLHREGVPLLASELAGHPLESMAGKPIAASEMPLPTAWRTGEPVREQYLLARDNSPPWQLDWTASPVRDSEGQLLGIVGTVACAPPSPDLRKLAELAHDLRTPLQSLRLLSSFVEGQPEASEETRARLKTIRWAADRAVQIALELLDLCRTPLARGTGHMGWFALEPFLLALADEHTATAASKGLSLVAALVPSQGWELQSDRVRLGRLLSNLLVNAIRYTPMGRVELATAWRGEAAGRFLVISVLDTGPGISAEEQESVFQAFERGRAGKEGDSSGSGLGLAIVDRLAEELGVSLEVYSEYGGGTAFHLRIPHTLLRPLPA
jgi:anti-sigma regulatory factor (Ser/Thr protein kinase)